ncbi:hypothetical protein CHU95_02740 [Niveispirillum lacus]|uniref:Outer membrane protein beta-barrel domain-containing protein n=1 Tax=Niveispirillum lacus TaxID=1981099 RepID=A0A255Z671_9PROT|nr:OmpW family outer membrane protein [Niveispirillum lacus]OYQ36921.1 hypothetical protein CHU95_02740 [Niveispirillum lacus]
MIAGLGGHLMSIHADAMAVRANLGAMASAPPTSRLNYCPSARFQKDLMMLRIPLFLRFMIIPAMFLSAPSKATAEGAYIKALGGLSVMQPDTARRGAMAPVGADFDSGFATGAAVGYAFTSNLAMELEFMYRTADLAKFDNPILGTVGDYASATVTAHALYTFDGWYTGAMGTCRPFIGVGLGTVEEVDFDLAAGISNQEYEASGDILWQVRAGADWAFAKDWSLTAELRYLDMGTPSLKSKSGGQNLVAGYSTIDLLVGLTYRF